MMYRDTPYAVHPHQLRDPSQTAPRRASDDAAIPGGAWGPAWTTGGGTESLHPYDHRGRRTSHLSGDYSAAGMRPPLSDAAHPVAAGRRASDEPAAEHALKRKTPTRVLSSGYDGTPVDWHLGPSANKHLLMSRPEATRPVPYMNVHSAHVDHSYRSNNGFEAARTLDVFRGIPTQATPVPQGAGAAGWGYPPPNGTAQGSWLAPGHAPSLESLIHSVPLPAYYNGVGYQTMPNVMQPMWYPNVGPTASGAQLPYGPYWPSGAFEPYRPAAVRDTRFNHQFSRITLGESAVSLASLDDPTRRVSTGSSRLQEHFRPHPGTVPHHPVRPAMSHFATDSFLSRRQGANPALLPEGFPRAPQHPMPQIFGPTASSHHYHLPQQSHTWPLDPSRANYPSGGTQQSSSAKDSLHFRDRTLLWAHKVYLDLLSAAQQTRRSSNHSSSGSDRRSSSQPPFLPKPPKYTSISPTTLRKALPKTPINFSNEAQNSRRVAVSESHDFDARWSTQANGSGPSIPPQHSMMQRGYPTYPPPSPYNQVQAHYPVSVTIPNTPSATTQAQQALSMLSRLVVESNWSWIDGMLLGGCLAYGLSDHKIAYEWYSQVLAREPNNVEGLSNLAATAAILGQFGEAEQHWKRAVNLRPTYFEAVEHLIGLLCQDQRAREAVEVLESVESALKTESTDQSPPIWVAHAKRVNETVPLSMDRHSNTLSLETSSAFSGFNIPSSENGRLIALIHAKGNMLYGLGDNIGASRAFEDAIMVAVGKSSVGVAGLIRYILQVFANFITAQKQDPQAGLAPCETILLLPEVALKTAEMAFPGGAMLPGFRDVAEGNARKAAVSVASNSLLSLAKIYQDGMSSSNAPNQPTRAAPGVQEILALYYLSLSLQPSPSTANNVGILLAGVQQSAPVRNAANVNEANLPKVPGVVPGSGIALALAYYNYGLNLDNRHAHLYTNLGSLLKDIGQLNAAIKMYEQAVLCDGSFDIALANLANAVKDQGRISDAIGYYKRAVTANPDFAEAVCGLANALNSVCQWTGRGGIVFPNESYDRWHVDDTGMLVDARNVQSIVSGWIGRVIAIVNKQLGEGKLWGKGVMQSGEYQRLLQSEAIGSVIGAQDQSIQEAIVRWTSDNGAEWEGARIVRLLERATRVLQWQLYQGKHIKGNMDHSKTFARPAIPTALAVPTAPTVLPFHTFTCPLNAAQIRKISQRNGLRISVSTLKAPWLSPQVYEPPKPPAPQLNVGYVSSDFNNHPLAHLMQSVFGFHDPSKVKAFCYATTASDKSVHREQIQREAPVFRDASSWPVDRLVKQILDDNVHILINLNGYTRGARNEVFAARPAPIQMSFMGFAGTLGAEWCDYLLADSTAVPPSTLRPHRSNAGFKDLIEDKSYTSEDDDWIYGENVIFTRDTFFCCDHRQSAPDAKDPPLSWAEELERRKKMRRELFPDLGDDTIILGNFNQLYKIDPTTFRTWLRILQNVPEAVLWLLRFPELGETNIRAIAAQWASPSVASRIIFTDVAPKQEHIARARICDLFLDTPECNAHTTAADVLWSGTPLLTLPRYSYKMCSRMAASILKGALPKGADGDAASRDLIAADDSAYEMMATRLARGLTQMRRGDTDNCRLLELRRMLFEGRWKNALFDTRRWVRDLEEAYTIAWDRWVAGEGGDIWL